MVEFIVPIKISGKLGLNRLYSGMHWGHRKIEAEKIHKLVKNSLPKHQDFLYPPVKIELSYNSRLDIDNHGFLAKLIIDGLIGVLLRDDRKNHVWALNQNFWDGDGVRVRIFEDGGKNNE
jgi:hypothetical protein